MVHVFFINETDKKTVASENGDAAVFVWVYLVAGEPENTTSAAVIIL